MCACGGQTSVDKSPDAPTVLTPKKNFYMRSSLDADPSGYLGRLIPDGVADSDLDEVSAEKHECYKFFEIKKIDGGGMTYDEYYQASTQASAGLKTPVKPVKAGADYGAERVFRVKYAQG